MYYIKEQKGNLWGICDSRDGVTEYHDLEYIRDCMIQKIPIEGVVYRNGRVIDVYPYNFNRHKQMGYDLAEMNI